MAHLLLTAAVRNPTVRSSFRAPRETLLRYDRAALYETILQVLGFDRVSALRSGGRRFMEQAPVLPASAGFHNPPTSISAARQAMMPE